MASASPDTGGNRRREFDNLGCQQDWIVVGTRLELADSLRHLWTAEYLRACPVDAVLASGYRRSLTEQDQ